ncbi:SDR family NAD(P)-dependent oxidoreductase [Sphingomonas fennica]|uniref:7-alpha-hydroxysteroid dehydrogenase n=1 Tax=Edaphosphingomonas fennica TaxID=114404 RepID=A0A2T4HZZ2_9SPHN|nr:SDR family oxidoreductase [Sphingomonas fennica]PTD22033.1 7-alpha-hydroxysteroid dehydrogenase [Sphingomonas fennica]
MADRVLEGQTAFITGGSGGIGSATARLLLQDGAEVLLMGRRGEALERTREALIADVPGARIDLHVGDAGQQADVEAGLDKAVAMSGRLDIIVPTVGGGGFRPILMHDADSFRAELDYNIITAFLAVRYGVPRMKAGGSIVLISSTAAMMPFPWLGAYCTAKGGLEQFVRTAADELAGANVRINAIRPGMTRSEATGAMFDDPAIIQPFIDQMPMGRAGAPEDIARGVRFLAGPESGWVTGQSLAVDGGHELRRNPDLTHLARGIFGSETIDAVLRGEEAPNGRAR